MTTTAVRAVVAAAQRLSPTEQFEVIQALARVLQQRYSDGNSVSLPAHVRRTPPVTTLAGFAGDFWPENESADDINAYVAQQRAADRMRDFPDGDV